MRPEFLLCAMIALIAAPSPPAQRPPNVVIIFVDDMGYGDLSCYGARGYQTPNLDRMAAQGMKFTDFYVGQAVCSASRAALLTGCYPVRVGILGALSPESKVGISDREILLPQLLKKQGYATALYGKWHLGDSPQFLPTRHGFDEYFGLPYSNDMMPKPRQPNYPQLPLIEQKKVVQRNPDQSQLTTWYTEHAVSFIARHKNAPFFLEVAHNMPHVPLHVSSKFAGKTQRGLYGDVIEEIDWSVGQILGAIREAGLDDNTLVIFTSDNGPWLLYGDHAGSAGPLREGKATSFDGGVRECCIMRWPGRIPAGRVCREMAWSMDVLPTVAKLCGTSAPADRIIDGRDVWPLISGQAGAKTPHEAYYVYWGRELQAIRSGNWKLHLPHDYVHPDPPGHGGKPGKYATLKIGEALYDLESDPGETKDVAAQHPDVVKRLEAIAAAAVEDLGDSRSKTKGKNVREPARLANPTGFRDQAALPDASRPDGLVHEGED